jgi:hypothetical protein
MSYPLVRQLGTGAQPETEQRPAKPGRRGGSRDGRSRVGRGDAPAVAAVVLAVVIALTVAANAGTF